MFMVQVLNVQGPKDSMDVHHVIQEDSDDDENATISTYDQDIAKAILCVESQSSSETTTLSNASQKLPEDSDNELSVKTFKEKESQAKETYAFIFEAEYVKLLKKASFRVDFRGTSMK